MKTDLQLLFPSVVQISDVPDSETLNRGLMAEINQLKASMPNTKPSSWACDLYTTIGNPSALLDHPAFTQLLALARQGVADLAQQLKFDLERQPIGIHECWFNVYESHQAQEIHLHRNSVFSGIYYVQVPPGSGATLFYSPNADVMLEPAAKEGSPLNAKVTGFAPKAGRMLWFRSHQKHSVMPGVMDGTRVTVAFNATI